MNTYSTKEKQILTRLQRGTAITSRPFQCSENEVFDVLQRAQADGLLRRFGGIFDARRLGYKSVLCALSVSKEQMEKKVAIVSAHPGVTHCYERRSINCRAGTAEGFPVLQKESHYPNLWFTFAMLHDEFDAGMAGLCSKLETRHSKLFQLPATRRFKIDVVFDLAKNRAGSMPAEPDEMTVSFRVFSEAEKKLVRALDQQVPLVERPFAVIAEQIGQTEEWVLSTLQDWDGQGILRRIGAILYHREAGFRANAMCVWPVAEEGIIDAGRRVAARPEVTHCYQRPRLDAFPFDLYAMIHAADQQKIRELFKDISFACGLSGGKLFISGREFKKTSMKYFR
jgi:siroheme decarboxylase